MMVNLFGEPGAARGSQNTSVSRRPSPFQESLHLYGKREVRPFRKMGHLCAIGSTADEAMSRAEEARALVKIRGR